MTHAPALTLYSVDQIKADIREHEGVDVVIGTPIAPHTTAYFTRLYSEFYPRRSSSGSSVAELNLRMKIYLAACGVGVIRQTFPD